MTRSERKWIWKNWRYTHFPLNHDYRRKGISFDIVISFHRQIMKTKHWIPWWFQKFRSGFVHVLFWHKQQAIVIENQTTTSNLNSKFLTNTFLSSMFGSKYTNKWLAHHHHHHHHHHQQQQQHQHQHQQQQQQQHQILIKATFGPQLVNLFFS